MSELADSVVDANGNRWVYRIVSSQLERRQWSSGVNFAVVGADFIRMTPAELRHVADVLERR